ncbi:ulp1 protease family, C-terminal catalytic domain-containing protein [Tanacetum coccineum]
MRKASLDYPGDQKFVELQEKYVQVFIDPILFDVDVNSVDDGDDSDGDDDNNDGNGNNDEELNDDNDDSNGNNDEELNVDNDDGNGNNDEELNDDNDDGNGNNDEELNDEDNLGSNPSFGFSKIGLDDFDKHPSKKGTDAEKNRSIQLKKEPLLKEIQLKNGDLFGDNSSVRMELSNQGPPTPDRMPTRASNASASPGKRIVKPSSYLLSTYMNKKTKVVLKITRLEFIIGNSLFAMQGDKIVYGIRLNLETLAPGLRIDSNVIDCWGAILNHEEKFRDAESKSRHFFSPVSKSMFDGTLPSDDDKWESFSNQVKAQFKGNEGGLALKGVDLKKLFARHLKLYGHSRHGTVGRLKHRILKLKWRTSGNFHDCGVFTMLHMESFNGETAAKWDCGLSVESGLQCDMLRRLRFKFATKILLHEINVHSKKMLELANEFDKVDSLERMAIIVKAVKNREERDRI